MPNWCENVWFIACRDTAERDAVQALMTLAEGEDDPAPGATDADRPVPGSVTFSKLVPMPAILARTGCGSAKVDGKTVQAWIEDRDAQGNRLQRAPTEAEAAELAATGYDNWYDWSIARWGCKWDAAQSDIDTGEDWLELRFHTPWGPPEPVLDALRARFPEITVTAFYHEPGQCMAGYLWRRRAGMPGSAISRATRCCLRHQGRGRARWPQRLPGIAGAWRGRAGLLRPRLRGDCEPWAVPALRRPGAGPFKRKTGFPAAARSLRFSA
ncbi:MAG: hypothetical protein JKP97_18350 [Rhodobacteraceae bacterium]|jgi:hypothetical protein|nr:hypothetical protein [Paracoccaceae bacterium]